MNRISRGLRTMITKRQLEQEGYKEYEKYHFQKCIKDSCGKRYFINIEFYDMDIQGRNFKGYDIKVQLQNINYDNNEVCLNLNLDLGHLTIIQLETMIEKIWLSLGLPYYEVF